MNCREYQEFFSDLFDGELPPDRRADLEGHLVSCAPCRAEYASFTDSLQALQGAAARPAGEGFAGRVMDAAQQEAERHVLFQHTGLRRPSTRRLVAPRRVAWTVPALAASALAAFAVGFFIQKQAADREIRDLEARISKQPPGKDAIPLVDKPALTSDQIVEAWLKEKNIVNVGGTWMSGDLAEHIRRGEVQIDGKWVPAKEEIDRRVRVELAKNPDSPDPKAAKERVLESLDIVRRGEGYVSKAIAEALDRGLVVSGTGEARSLEDLLADKLRDLKLVQHEGRWMSEEQRTELLAARRIHKNDIVTQNTAVTRALDGLEIGPPLGYRNLTLYPLIGTGAKGPQVTTLPEALAADKVDLVDDMNALQVSVRNKGDSDIVLLAGEILAGGRHGRVVARDAVVPAKKSAPVEVFDVEPAELRRGDKAGFRRESGHYWATLGLRRVLHEEQGQAGVWAAVLGSGSRPAPMDLYKEHRVATFEYRAALMDLRSSHPRMTGVAVAIGDTLVVADIFGSPELFAAHFDRILDSAAMEAILAAQARDLRGPSSLPSSIQSVKQMIEMAFTAEHDPENENIVVRRNGRPTGRAVTAGGEAVRVVLFPEGASEVRFAPELLITRGKLLRVLEGYEARLKSGPAARRPTLLREMAMLPGDLARQAVLAHAEPEDGPTRKFAIEALGLRGDPKAADPLLKLLKTSRNDPGLYGTLAQALGRLGSEEAVPVLLQDLYNAKTADLAKAASEHLPAMMSGVRNLKLLEEWMGMLIGALDRLQAQFPPDSGVDAQGIPWTLKPLRLITGREYARVSDYLLWWNNPLERAAFLDRRPR
jgi:hypothetical protein